MNLKMGCLTTGVLAATLGSLALEAQTLLLGGDLTDGGVAAQFERFASVLERFPHPTYACLGNHDLYAPEVARGAVSGPLARCFPGGSSHYHAALATGASLTALDSGPLFPGPPSLDGGAEVPGLPPRIAMRHYPLRNRHRPSSAGYLLPDWSTRSAFDEALLARAADLYFVGHCHWNEVMSADGGLHLQNPAFCEWPCAYRVVHIWPHAIRHQLRQVSNRWFVAASAVPAKRMSWMLSTGDGDLAGSLPFDAETPG